MSEVVEALSSSVGNGPAPVLVTAAEKDALGYENPEGVRNPELQRLAMRHRAEIYADVEPFVEEALGRDVELVGIYATYPYSAVNVTYRTADEPVVTSDAFVGLRSDGTVSSIERIEPIEIEYRTVEGLYLMAYRERISRMRQYIAATYPQFGQLPMGYARFMSRADPMFRFRDYSPLLKHQDAERAKADDTTIYEAYVQDPSRTDAEWFEIFEELYGSREMAISLHLILADPAVELTEEMSRQVADDVRSNPLFAGYGQWRVFTFSNQMLRDENKAYMFHREFILTADREQSEWWVDMWVDGATVLPEQGLSPQSDGRAS